MDEIYYSEYSHIYRKRNRAKYNFTIHFLQRESKLMCFCAKTRHIYLTSQYAMNYKFKCIIDCSKWKMYLYVNEQLLNDDKLHCQSIFNLKSNSAYFPIITQPHLVVKKLRSRQAVCDFVNQFEVSLQRFVLPYHAASPTISKQCNPHTMRKNHNMILPQT